MHGKVLKPFIFIFFIMGVVSLACQSVLGTPIPEPPTATEAPPQPLPTEEPLQLEVPTQTVEPTVPAPQKFFTEEFDGDLSNWTYFNVLGSDETSESGLSLEANNGYLGFDIATKELYTYVMYEPYTYKDVAIDILAENRGTNNNAITLVCRYSNEGWYEISIQNSGLYVIWTATYDANGTIQYNKIADGGSTKIKVGKEINEYKMICKDRTISLYINGFETRVLDDNRYVLEEGQVGFSVSSFNDPTVKVDVDWVTISQP